MNKEQRASRGTLLQIIFRMRVGSVGFHHRFMLDWSLHFRLVFVLHHLAKDVLSFFFSLGSGRLEAKHILAYCFIFSMLDFNSNRNVQDLWFYNWHDNQAICLRILDSGLYLCPLEKRWG